MLLDILPLVLGQYLASCIGGFVILELKVLRVRPAKRIQEKSFCVIIMDFQEPLTIRS